MKIIALNGDYRYLNNIETTIKSIIFNNKEVKIYVINPDIPHEWFINLNQYVNQIGSTIVDAKVDPERLKDMHSSHERINSTAFGRFLIPELVDEDRVLYLDCDLIVNDNLNKLFEIDFGDKMLFAVRDYNENNWFNSGVMFINNRKWKTERVIKTLLEKGKIQLFQMGIKQLLMKFSRDKLRT